MTRAGLFLNELKGGRPIMEGMMNIRRNGFIGALLATLTWAGTASGQDPVAAAPQAFKERLNNPKVRVLEYASRPGGKEAMHEHGPTVLYVIQGGKTRHTFPDGRTRDAEYKAGDVMWREPVTHSVENIGKMEVRLILVEVRPEPGPAGKP